jgi:O-methyltransferase
MQIKREHIRAFLQYSMDLLWHFIYASAKLFGIYVSSLKTQYIDFTTSDFKVIESVQPYTLQSPESIYSLIQATKYIVHHKIPGAIVECGVWKGGSMMVIAQTLLDMGISDRELYLFDTYEGMPKPQEVDIDWFGLSAIDIYEMEQNLKGVLSHFRWLPSFSRSLHAVNSFLNEVQGNMLHLGYDAQRIHFIKGKVEDTLPDTAPETIALLRLDTDWYESTRHELEHLFPRVSRGGVLIVDDYGYWQGSKKAVDEYFSLKGMQILLNRIDATVRIAIKQ